MTAYRTMHLRDPLDDTSTTTFGAFAQEVFGHLPRQDQRRWAETYLKGLLGTPGKKSVRRMASAVSAAPTASQSLHQFISASPWPWDPARRALARWSGQRAAVRAWTLAPIVAPKRGLHSVGVHRRYDAAAGRVINCQVGIGLHLSTCCGDVPVDWRLHLPETWCADPELRQRARIPDSGDPRPLWELGLEMVDTLAAQSAATPPPVVADGRELGDAVALANGLSTRCCKFLVSVPGNLTLHAGPHPGSRPLRLDTPARLHAPRSPRALWTLSGPVHLPGAHHTMRLLAKWHPARTRPARIWMTNLVHAGLDDLLALVGTQAGTKATMQSLREDFGLLDFEGRSFPGWHRHTTLVSAAYGWHRLSGASGHAHGRDGREPRAAAAPPSGFRQVSC
ncbi:transposase [Streptomyces sp. NPDC006544]|uniref:IS701 family transposase n=1 Tax=Streptomyces sp. NPDC006544 TaxID=3154583 RepID=UPI0033B386C8